MRIVCLITVGAFLLSIAIAESDVPIGTTGQYHHQRLPRPIILEPVVKLKSESSPFDWFFKMVSRVMDPPKKPPPPPPMIGPINLPGMGGQVYIRQIENNLPWESSHVVIKMVMRDPVTGMNVPFDSGQTNYRQEESSQRFSKPSYGYGTNNHAPRVNNPSQGGFLPSSSTNQHQSWQSRQRPQNYPYNQPLRVNSPNDLRHDDYIKNQAQDYPKANQEDYNHRRFPSNNYNSYTNNHEENYERFRSVQTSNRDSSGTTISSQPSIYRSVSSRAPNDPVYGNDYNDPRHKDSLQKSRANDFYSGKPDSSRSTQNPYPEFAGREIDHVGSMKSMNQTRSNENHGSNDYRNPSRYRQFVRNDRMVGSNNRNYYGDISTRERNHFRGSNPSQGSRGFRESSPTKFDLEDVGGLEVITAPNLKNRWNEGIGIDKNKDGKSRESDLNQGEDSISMGNGKNLARGESAEHINEEEREISNSRMSQARLTSYKIIDRSHRSQGSQNISLLSDNEDFQALERTSDKTNNSYDDESKLQNSRDIVEGNERVESRIGNFTGEVIHKVMNLTASNRWRFQEGRRPSRIVKAIYRRRPIGEILKGNGEIGEGVDSKESNSTYRSSMDN